MEAITDKQMSAKLRSGQLKSRSELIMAINLTSKLIFVFAFSLFGFKSETRVLRLSPWTNKQLCVLLGFLTVLCSHEGLRHLPPRSFRLGRCKLTLDHGLDDNSAAGVLSRPCERSLSTGIPQYSLLFQYFVLYKVDPNVKNTVWFPNVEIFSIGGEIAKGYNESASACDDWCFDYSTLNMDYYPHERSCVIVEGCRSWTYYLNEICYLYDIILPLTLPSPGSWTGLYVK